MMSLLLNQFLVINVDLNMALILYSWMITFWSYFKELISFKHVVLFFRYNFYWHYSSVSFWKNHLFLSWKVFFFLQREQINLHPICIWNIVEKNILNFLFFPPPTWLTTPNCSSKESINTRKFQKIKNKKIPNSLFKTRYQSLHSLFKTWLPVQSLVKKKNKRFISPR